MNRTSDCFGGLCSGPPCLEFLEDRQLPSGIPVAGNLPAKPPALEQFVLGPIVQPTSQDVGELVQSTHPEGDVRDTVIVYLGNGDGTFQPAARVAARIDGGPTAAADFNRDGTLDLVVLKPRSRSIDVLLGIGDGSFRVFTTIHTGRTPHSVAVVDFNRDGVPDLVVNEDSRKPSKISSQASAPMNLDQSLTASLDPTRVVAKTQGALLANLGTLAETQDVASTKASAPTVGPTAGITGNDAENWIPPLLPAASNDVAQTVIQEPCDDLFSGLGNTPSPPAGQLLAGLLPIDLAGLERKVDEFFRQIKDLAEDATEPGTIARLSPWLAAGSVLTAGYALARRHLRPRGPDNGTAEKDRRNPAWSGVPGEAPLLLWENS
jgi:hypothetical protein